jgi:hypothetical protein
MTSINNSQPNPSNAPKGFNRSRAIAIDSVEDNNNNNNNDSKEKTKSTHSSIEFNPILYSTPNRANNSSSNFSDLGSHNARSRSLIERANPLPIFSEGSNYTNQNNPNSALSTIPIGFNRSRVDDRNIDENNTFSQEKSSTFDPIITSTPKRKNKLSSRSLREMSNNSINSNQSNQLSSKSPTHHSNNLGQYHNISDTIPTLPSNKNDDQDLLDNSNNQSTTSQAEKSLLKQNERKKIKKAIKDIALRRVKVSLNKININKPKIMKKNKKTIQDQINHILKYKPKVVLEQLKINKPSLFKKNKDIVGDIINEMLNNVVESAELKSSTDKQHANSPINHSHKIDKLKIKQNKKIKRPSPLGKSPRWIEMNRSRSQPKTMTKFKKRTPYKELDRSYTQSKRYKETGSNKRQRIDDTFSII